MAEPLFRHPLNLALHAAWQAARGSGLAPRKEAFDLLALGSSRLEWAALFDVEGPGLWRYRYFGPSLSRLVGRDMTGCNLFDLYSGRRRAIVEAYLAAVVAEGAMARSTDLLVTRSGLHYECEFSQFPLLGPDGRVARILSGTGILERPADPTADLEGQFKDVWFEGAYLIDPATLVMRPYAGVGKSGQAAGPAATRIDKLAGAPH